MFHGRVERAAWRCDPYCVAATRISRLIGGVAGRCPASLGPGGAKKRSKSCRLPWRGVPNCATFVCNDAERGSRMARMKAIDAAVRVLEREGVTVAFGVPGAAINPMYSVLRARGTTRHILARHVEGASHMADGYTRTTPGGRVELEAILGKVANISMGTEVDSVNAFEDILRLGPSLSIRRSQDMGQPAGPAETPARVPAPVAR